MDKIIKQNTYASAFTALILAQSLTLLYSVVSASAQDRTASSGRLSASISQATNNVSRLPVKEVTIFKDGHAVINQEGQVGVNPGGEVFLDNLPAPLLGTFFPYSPEGGDKLVAVTTGKRKIKSEKTALNLFALIASNPGAQVRIDELSGSGDSAKVVSYDATIIGIPTRSAEELARALSSGTSPDLLLPVKSDLVELKTETGTTFIPLSRIQTVTFKGSHKTMEVEEEIRDVMTLRLDKASAKANVGMMYVQKGLRWIPSYKVIIDGQGKAKVKLQATVVNDLIDMEDVNANLVIGVPSFAFNGDTDPISLSGAIAQVAQYAYRDSRIRNAFSNSIMSQSASYADEEAAPSPAPAPGPGVTGGSKSEDLYVFNVKHLTLKKGERMVIPVQEYNVDYKDVYTLDLPVLPPQEVLASSANAPQKQITVEHKIRLSNTGKQPFTTAPALVLAESAGVEQVLAQGMMTYASPGSFSDVSVNTAIDIKVKQQERELSRVQDAVTWQDYKYARINMAGDIELTNYGAKPVTVEVTRKVLGKLENPGKEGSGGKTVMLNPLEEWSKLGMAGYYSFPQWWAHMNGVGKFSWKKEIAPKDSTKLDYSWHYFWRY